MKQSHLQTMLKNNLLDKTGTVLDLGCGTGNDSIFLADLGYDVTAVDVKPPNIFHPKITFIQNDLTKFHIEEGKYSAIITRNSLPFIKDKKMVKEILVKMVHGLTQAGVMFFTVFGVKDGWFGKENMSFFTLDEIDGFLKKLPINLFEKNVLEGYGTSMSGEFKFWNVFSYLCTKKKIVN